MKNLECKDWHMKKNLVENQVKHGVRIKQTNLLGLAEEK